MYWHWQNLDEDKRGNKKGRGWRSGRAWLANRPYDMRHDDGVRVWPLIPGEQRIEWHAFHRSSSLSIGYSRDDEDHQLQLAIPRIVELYYSWENKRFHPRDWQHSHAAWTIRHHNGGLWWSIGANPMGGPHTWREGNIHWLRTVLGKRQHSNSIAETRTMPLPLPEGTVDATVEEHHSEWRYRRWPRFPLVKRMTTYNITPHRPASIPGKGENAWDIDDDAIYELSCRAESFEDAIGHFVASVLRDRKRHGGSYEWQTRHDMVAD